MTHSDPEIKNAVITREGDPDGVEDVLARVRIGPEELERRHPPEEEIQVEAVAGGALSSRLAPQNQFADVRDAAQTLTEPPATEPAPLPMLLDPLGRARVPLIAFTATWGRADGLALGRVFRKIVWHADWLEMIRGKWCVRSRTRAFF